MKVMSGETEIPVGEKRRKKNEIICYLTISRNFISKDFLKSGSGAAWSPTS